jgi:hypothetical protein
MRIRRPRLLALPAVAAAGLLASMLAAAPALAAGGASAGPGGGSGPGTISVGGATGCSGQSCYADVWSHVTMSGTPGAYTSGDNVGSQTQVQMPPPPCYMEPLFSGPEMYTLFTQGLGQKVGPNGTPAEQGYMQFKSAIDANKDNTDGYWYSPVITDLTATCSLPLLAWVPNGTTPPLPHVPEIDLADFAYNHFNLPDPVLILNPTLRSYVSLPTYAWDTLAGGDTEQATATLGAEAATVTAVAGHLVLTVGEGGTAYNNCSATGSAAKPVGTAPANAGPGTTPDCGVVFHTASNGNTIVAKIRWNIGSTYGGFDPIYTRYDKSVAVAEIQGLNTGNN